MASVLILIWSSGRCLNLIGQVARATKAALVAAKTHFRGSDALATNCLRDAASVDQFSKGNTFSDHQYAGIIQVCFEVDRL